MTSSPQPPAPRRTGINTVRIIGLLLLLPILAFACFGLIATFEPLEGGTRWAWRAAYLMLVIGCLVSIVRFLRMK